MVDGLQSFLSTFWVLNCIKIFGHDSWKEEWIIGSWSVAFPCSHLTGFGVKVGVLWLVGLDLHAVDPLSRSLDLADHRPLSGVLHPAAQSQSATLILGVLGTRTQSVCQPVADWVWVTCRNIDRYRSSLINKAINHLWPSPAALRCFFLSVWAEWRRDRRPSCGDVCMLKKGGFRKVMPWSEMQEVMSEITWLPYLVNLLGFYTIFIFVTECERFQAWIPLAQGWAVLVLEVRCSVILVSLVQHTLVQQLNLLLRKLRFCRFC